MEIRESVIDDLPRLAEFYGKVTQYLMETVNYPRWIHGVYPSEESVRAAIAEGSQFMCMAENKIVGAFVLNEDQQGDYEAGKWKLSLTRGEYLVMHMLAVRPDFYGCGVGKFMTEFCLDFAEKSGYRAVRLDVVPQNFPARKLYEKTGFHFVGIRDMGRSAQGVPEFALYERQTGRRAQLCRAFRGKEEENGQTGTADCFLQGNRQGKIY